MLAYGTKSLKGVEEYLEFFTSKEYTGVCLIRFFDHSYVYYFSGILKMNTIMIDKERAYRIIKDYFKDKPVRKIQVIGSFARNEQKDGSDIDIIVEMEHPVGLITFSGYRLDLEDLLGINVDLTTTKGVSPHVQPLIETDLETVYEK